MFLFISKVINSDWVAFTYHYWYLLFVGLAHQGKDIVSKFIREYSSLRILSPR
jgi:hypothetical protein